MNGKPPTSSKEWGYKGGQQKGQGKAHMTIVPERACEEGEFNTETIEKLSRLLGTLEKSNTSTCSLVQSGKVSNSIGLNVSDKCDMDSWIIDSGATDHMSHSPHIFTTYTPWSSNMKISVADGSLTTVAGIGDAKITPTFNL